MKNPNLFPQRPAAESGIWFDYRFPWRENTPWLEETGSGDYLSTQ